MVISTSNYSDFKVIVSRFDCNKTVLYAIISPTQFIAYGFDKSQATSVGINTDSTPVTFNSDFPNAILLSTNFGVSG